MTTAARQTHLVSMLITLHTSLQRMIARRVGTAVASDLTQELYLRVHRVTADLASDTDAKRYLMRMAANAAADYKRTENRRDELLTSMLTVFDNPIPGPEEDVESTELLAGIDTALEQLPSRCREILYLSRIEGMTHAEIATRLLVSKSLVEKSVMRGLSHVKRTVRRLSDS